MFPRSLVSVFIFCATLSTLVSAQTEYRASARAEINRGASWIEWSAPVPADKLILTVSGPGGLYLKQEQARPRFEALDEDGRPCADGRYAWELLVQITGKPSEVLSGWFDLRGGRIINSDGPGEKAPAAVEPGAPENSVYVDQEGRVGIGTAVPGAQLHVKGTGASLAIEDTQAGGHEYRLRSKDNGDGSLGLFDQATGDARWLVDRTGRIGVNTTTPTSTLTVDGYIESTKGFLVNGRPVGGIGLFGSSQPLATEGSSNTLFGYHAGFSDSSISSSSDNAFFGAYAGENTAYPAVQNSFFGTETGQKNTSGSNNSFFGTRAGWDNTIGYSNSFFGIVSGNMNTTGKENCFFGASAASNNTIGSDNCFFGFETGRFNSEGSRNSFFGYTVGFNNATGNRNSFFGDSAGYHNTASYNSFFGVESGYANTTGSFNAFFGSYSGRYNTTGYENSFFGDYAGWLNTTGTLNCFFGHNAGLINSTGTSNSFFGMQAGDWNTVENHNTFIGYNADLDPGPSPSTNPVTNATAIGANAYVAQANSLVLGSIPGLNGASSYVNVGIGTTTPYYSIHVVRTGANAAVVAQRTDGASNYMNAGPSYANFGSANNYPLRLTVNATWRLRLNTDNSLTMVNGATCTAGGVWTDSSSREVKDNISALSSQEAIETLDGLSPVKFTYKADETEKHVGFIAEEVPDLVAMKNRKSLSPMDIVAVLTRVVQEQQAELTGLKAEVETLKALLRGQ